MEQYQKWEQWLVDKTISIGQLRTQLAEQSKRYQDLVEQIRVSFQGKEDPSKSESVSQQVSPKTFLEKGADIISFADDSME
eukprot:2294024-Pyramimonas_sp.AAC.1